MHIRNVYRLSLTGRSTGTGQVCQLYALHSNQAGVVSPEHHTKAVVLLV